VAIALVACWRLAGPASANAPLPADLFMQSVATEDGALGWQQLCPALQQQLPRDGLAQQTLQLRTSQQQAGETLTIEHVGDRPRPTGGEIRVYVATAHAADGSGGQKAYVVLTQSSGCVESVE
jgi:hypothetical protein